MKEKTGYNQTSSEWDNRAGVRSNPETYDLHLVDDLVFDGAELSWHLPSYSGILAHEGLSNLSNKDKEYVKGTQLLEFVTKQTIFEIDCVNYVASRLAHGKYPFVLPESLKLDALKIYIDEGYHAYYTQKIANQIRSYYGINDEDITPFIGGYYSKIERKTSKYGDKNKDLCMLAFVIAGENQIVSDISEQMRKVVYEPIRAMFRDHMKDEVFHAKFFTEIFREVWPQLDNNQKEIMGLSFCDSMEILGLPRTDIYYFSLSNLGFNEDQIAGFIDDIYNTAEWRTTKIVDRMSPTLNLLFENDVFSIDTVKDAFVDKGYFK
jgi:hypothetical protein